ncbi:hypothetical protein K432DRAFT_437918, partial [Lepidopterella palustris CBS 459.81]
MPPPTNRKGIVNLKNHLRNGKAIVGFIEIVGGDLIIIYKSGHFQMAGRGLLAGLILCGNAEVLPIAKQSPVLAGIHRSMPAFRTQFKGIGDTGLQNFPCGPHRWLILTEPRRSRLQLSRGMELLTTPYVFSTAEAVKMSTIGTHVSFTTSGNCGAATEDAQHILSMDKCIHGFNGASSMERFPVEEAIIITRSFKRMIQSR